MSQLIIISFYISDDVTYLYKLEKGISDKGYAVHVYKMVGLEDCIVKRAKRKSEELEENAKKYR